MAITPKNEEKLQELETALKERGSRLPVTEVADFGRILKVKKLQDGLRAAIYITSLHETDVARADWDKKINVKELMENLRENL